MRKSPTARYDLTSFGHRTADESALFDFQVSQVASACIRRLDP